jgi:scyllo-inositol 2-dehydrogenase (NADP+)
MSVSCAVVGYGPAFNMGKAHAGWIQKTKGMDLFAVCDVDPKRTRAAEEDFPGIRTFNNLDDLLKEDFDLATIVTPHNVHAPLALKCLQAGRHVIVEKPMCITTEEATRMIEASRRSKVMLSVFHNRRWDGDFMALKEIIDKGLIGDVYQIEAYAGGYGHPGKWWRSNKEVSGGAMYDWGAHFLDWILNLVPDKMEGIVGFSQKLVWKDVTNEDDVRAIIRFKSGAVADFQQSSIAMVGKPRWRILGSKGGIVDGDKVFRVSTFLKGLRAEVQVKYRDSNWDGYYQNISDHLNRGRDLVVKPEEARRVIAVMETAEKSWRNGSTMERVPYE